MTMQLQVHDHAMNPLWDVGGPDTLERPACRTEMSFVLKAKMRKAAGCLSPQKERGGMRGLVPMAIGKFLLTLRRCREAVKAGFPTALCAFLDKIYKFSVKSWYNLYLCLYLHKH